MSRTQPKFDKAPADRASKPESRMQKRRVWIGPAGTGRATIDPEKSVLAKKESRCATRW